jgi:hypothetical protein
VTRRRRRAYPGPVGTLPEVAIFSLANTGRGSSWAFELGLPGLAAWWAVEITQQPIPPIVVVASRDAAAGELADALRRLACVIAGRLEPSRQRSA